MILDQELDYCEKCDDHYGFVSVDSVDCDVSVVAIFHHQLIQKQHLKP